MATSSERTSCLGFTRWKHHASFSKLNPDRINSMFANSTTWRSKEEEQKGRAAIHASQVNRSSASSLDLFGIGCHRSMRTYHCSSPFACSGYSAANARAFASATASQEDLEAERQSSLKRKQQQEEEVAALLQEAQSAQGASPSLRLQAIRVCSVGAV